MSTAKTSFFKRHDRVLLYVPNLIGYFRVACIVYAFAAADRHPRSCLLVYFVGFACDELDGRFARMLDQRSRLGAVLDMATDRVSTAGLLALLCKFAPAYSLLWALLIVLDVSSHWFQMYATLACGDTTHKEAQASNPLIRLYYSQRIFMGFCCVSCEVLYLTTYALCHPNTPQWTAAAPASVLQASQWAAGCSVPSAADALIVALQLLAVPGVLVKQVVNVWQLLEAMHKLARLEGKSD